MCDSSVKKLLSLQNSDLNVSKISNGSITVCYPDSYIKDGYFLIGAYGTGETFEKACEDYLSQISGKTLVFHPYSESRKEVIVL